MDYKDKKIVFLGTPAIAAFFLEGLYKAGYNIVGVITREDKPQGRKMELKPSKVAETATRLGLKVFKPHILNKEYSFLDELQPDLLLTFAYGRIVSMDVLNYSKFKPLNIHPSLLPKYRGAAPIQYALRNGDEMTGICLMEMVKEMDAGDVYALKELPIAKEDNYSSLCLKVQQVALDLALENLPKYFEGKLSGQPQDSSKVTFCPSLKKEDEHLSLNQKPFGFVNQVRSLSEVPGGYLIMPDGGNLKIYQASVFDEKVEGEAGKILVAQKKDIILQLAEGRVKLEILQKPGKKAVAAQDFNNGARDFLGTILK